MNKTLNDTVPNDADPVEVARRVDEIIATERGKRPFRIVIEPANDGALVSFPVVDRIRKEFLTRLGFPDPLHPKI